ncbi:MAG: carbohydrate kinase family protein [Calothrix sp. SM1_7_51]|nr:carbohydrate kinase family protein [Calothrix sp. SM1_7_51]
MPRFDVKAIDATGSGDAFLVGLAVGLLSGDSLESAGKFASAAAALTTKNFGVDASLPRRSAIQDLLASVAPIKFTH